VEEASGRILQERSERSQLPGIVKSDRRTLTYGPVGEGWQVVRAETFERWLGPSGVAQVQRDLATSDFKVNAPDFLASRKAARDSDGTMLRETVEGQRYLVKQADGTRRQEEKPKSSGRAVAGVVLMDPTLPLPVVPLAGLAYFDYNAFGKGIQINFITALVYNQGKLVVPRLAWGFDLNAGLQAMLLPGTERPVRDGHLQDKEGVARRFGTLDLGLGRDLGAGFRLDLGARVRGDRYSLPWEKDYRTPGYVLPPSGFTRELRGGLSWLHRGFTLEGHYGAGRRPQGVYGAPEALQEVPDQGQFRRWGGRAGYDYRLETGAWLHGEGGLEGGKGFDRFQALDMGGTGGDVRVAGIRSHAIAADQLRFLKAGLVLPSGRNLRLTLTLDQAWLRSLDNQKTYAFTGLGAAGDLPGFGWFTSVRLDLGLGLYSTMPGVRSFNGYVALLRVF
jgi:hypothetical protein